MTKHFHGLNFNTSAFTGRTFNTDMHDYYNVSLTIDFLDYDYINSIHFTVQKQFNNTLIYWKMQKSPVHSH